VDTAPDLETVDTAELIRELKKRFTALVLIAERPHFNDEGQTVTVFAWGAPSVNHGLGLTVRAHGEMERKVKETTIEHPEEE
jgi:hypothetical protein